MKSIFRTDIAYLLMLCILLFLCSGTAAQQKTAQPIAGDGIGSFLLRNGYNIGQYRDSFIELNKKRLGKGNSLLMGVNYVLPEKENLFKIVKLFGKKHEQVKVESNELTGTAFYLVSGHGGPDPGAMGELRNHVLCEDEYAYDIVLRLARELIKRGAKVDIIIEDPDDGIRDEEFLSIDNHETCGGREIPLNQVQRLRQRCEVINAKFKTDKVNYKYCRAVFVHLDSRNKDKQIDMFLYHCRKSTLGHRLATTMLETFRQKYEIHQPGRGFEGTVSERNLQVLNESNPVCVFLELGNMQNSQDQKRFLQYKNREAVAKWMADGITADYKANKKDN